MTSQIFAIIAPVFLLAAVGFIWARLKQPFDHNMVSTLVFYVGAPCLLLSQLLTHRVDIDVMAEILVAGAAAMTLTATAAFILLKVMGASVRSYLPAMTFPNVGNMGLPLCLFAFGDVGLALAIAYFAVTSIFQFTLGIGIASGKADINLVVRNPVLWALGIALVLLSADVTLPDWVMNTLEMGGNFAIPLMLMSLGTSLATLSVDGLGRALTFSIFRLAGGFCVGLVVTMALGLEGPARGAVIIQSAMPTAVFNYLFAARYNNSPSDVAGIVLISTVLSFLTLPLLLTFVLA
jgi:predicted permease